MRLRYLTYFFVLAILVLGGCHKAPDGVDNQGHPIYLKEYVGKWLIVNYWATWCAPCLKELPELNRLQQMQQGKVVVLAVHFDGPITAETHRMIDPLKLNIPLLSSFSLDPKWGINEVGSLPMTLIIKPDGTLFKKIDGPQTVESLLKIISLSA